MRDLPPGHGFLVPAGLEPALDHLSRSRVGPSDVRAFAVVLGRSIEELEPLHGLSFDGARTARFRKGGSSSPVNLLEVTAPLHQARLVETYPVALVLRWAGGRNGVILKVGVHDRLPHETTGPARK